MPPLCPRITHSTGSGCERGGRRGPHRGRQVPTGGGSSSPRRARGPPRKWRCCPGSSVQPPQAPGGRPGRCPWPCAQLTSLLLKYLRAPSRSVSTNFRLKNCPLSRPRFQRKPSRYPGGEGPCRTAATLTRQRPGWTLFPSPGDPQPPGAGRPAGVSGHQPVLGPQATPSPPGCTLRPFFLFFLLAGATGARGCGRTGRAHGVRSLGVSKGLGTGQCPRSSGGAQGCHKGPRERGQREKRARQHWGDGASAKSVGSPPGLGGAGGDPPRRSQPCPLLSFGPEPHGGAPTCRDRRVRSRRLKARSPQSASQQQWVRRQPLRRPRPFPSACSGALCLRSAPHVPPGLGQLPLCTTLLDVLLLPDQGFVPLCRQRGPVDAGLSTHAWRTDAWLCPAFLSSSAAPSAAVSSRGRPTALGHSPGAHG